MNAGAPYSFKPRERRELEGKHRLTPGYYEVKLKYAEPNERALLEARAEQYIRTWKELVPGLTVNDFIEKQYTEYDIAGHYECFDDSCIDWTVPPIQLKRAE